jgi:putative phosphoesterase
MKIGVVSDTHGFFDARLAKLWAGVELILHAGDVGNLEVLDELERIAPVRAVKGNVDSLLFDLPLRLSLSLGETTRRGASRSAASTDAVQVEMLHELPAAQTELDKWANHARAEEFAPRGRDAFLRAFEQDTRVVIFGHSHVPCAVTLCGRLFFNPGSAGKQRFSLPRCCGLLDLSAKQVEATILSLQQYNRKLPEKVVMRLGARAA